jgi:hypothetical protein
VLELFQPLFAAPVLPASILLLVLVGWSLLTITVGFGADGHLPFHFHWDSHLDGWLHGLSDALGVVVLTPIKWLNLRSIPLFLWFGVFSITWFAVSLSLWMVIDDWYQPLASKNLGIPVGLVVTGLIIRNLFLSLIVTKFATRPMTSWFANTPELNSKSLLGAEAEICSYDATPESGQAKFKTDGAPLLLNVRTDGPHLPKGARVWLAHYDEKRRVYIVSPITSSPDSNQGNAT